MLVFGELLELRVVEHALEAFAGGEDHAHVGDVAGGEFLRSRRAFARDRQTERAEIAQFHDPSVGELVGDDVQERFEHGRGIRTAHRGHAVDAPGEAVRVHAPGALHGGVVLRLVLQVAGIFAG